MIGLIKQLSSGNWLAALLKHSWGCLAREELCFLILCKYCHLCWKKLFTWLRITSAIWINGAGFFITLFISSTWCDWKTELYSPCLRLLIIKEVKYMANIKHVCKSSELTSVCSCIVSLICKMGGKMGIATVLKEREQWFWIIICELFGDALVTGGWEMQSAAELCLLFP